MVTPIGLDVDSTWDALLRGVSGAGPITQFDASGQAVRFACEVEGFDPLQYLDKKGARRADRFLQFAIGAAAQAMEQAGFGDGLAHLPPDRTGVVVGVAVGGLPLLEAQHRKLLSRGPRAVSPLLIPMFIPDMTVGLLSIRVRGARPELRDRVGLRLERSLARARLPLDPEGRDGRDDRRGHGVRHHAARGRRLRVDGIDVDAQRRSRGKPAVPSTPAETAS